MKSFVRTVLFLCFLLAVAGAFAFAFWPQPLDVEWADVSRGRLTVTVDEDGQTRVRDRYVVSAPLAGQMQRIELDPGDPVAQGELLTAIEPHEVELLDPRTLAQARAKVDAGQAAVERAGATLKRAGVELERALKERDRLRGLNEHRAVPPNQLDDAEMLASAREQDFKAAQFAEQVANFELRMAEAALMNANSTPASGREPFPIPAPVNGQVLRVLQQSATSVTPGMRLLELGDPEDIEVEVDVLSSDAVKIRPRARVECEQWGGERPLRGHVKRVEPSAFTKISALGVEEQRVWVIIDFDPGQKPPALADGFRVEARIVVWEQDDVLRVPTGALFRAGDDWAVFAVEHGRARLRRVQLGQRNSLQAQVLEGLEEGEAVLLHPSDKVRDGIRIRRHASLRNE